MDRSYAKTNEGTDNDDTDTDSGPGNRARARVTGGGPSGLRDATAWKFVMIRDVRPEGGDAIQYWRWAPMNDATGMGMVPFGRFATPVSEMSQYPSSLGPAQFSPYKRPSTERRESPISGANEEGGGGKQESQEDAYVDNFATEISSSSDDDDDGDGGGKVKGGGSEDSEFDSSWSPYADKDSDADGPDRSGLRRGASSTRTVVYVPSSPEGAARSGANVPLDVLSFLPKGFTPSRSGKRDAVLDGLAYGPGVDSPCAVVSVYTRESRIRRKAQEEKEKRRREIKEMAEAYYDDEETVDATLDEELWTDSGAGSGSISFYDEATEIITVKTPEAHASSSSAPTPEPAGSKAFRPFPTPHPLSSSSSARRRGNASCSSSDSGSFLLYSRIPRLGSADRFATLGDVRDVYESFLAKGVKKEHALRAMNFAASPYAAVVAARKGEQQRIAALTKDPRNFRMTPVRHLDGSRPERIDKKTLVSQYERDIPGFAAKLRSVRASGARASSVANGRFLSKKLRISFDSAYDKGLAKLPLTPDLSFFNRHSDLYYLSDDDWILPGSNAPFWITHPKYVETDSLKPGYGAFLNFIHQINPRKWPKVTIAMAGRDVPMRKPNALRKATMFSSSATSSSTSVPDPFGGRGGGGGGGPKVARQPTVDPRRAKIGGAPREPPPAAGFDDSKVTERRKVPRGAKRVDRPSSIVVSHGAGRTAPGRSDARATAYERYERERETETERGSDGTRGSNERNVGAALTVGQREDVNSSSSAHSEESASSGALSRNEGSDESNEGETKPVVPRTDAGAGAKVAGVASFPSPSTSSSSSSSVKRKTRIAFRPDRNASSFALYNDCYRLTVRYTGKYERLDKEEADELEDFSLIMFGSAPKINGSNGSKGSKGTRNRDREDEDGSDYQTWGIKVPKSAIEVSLKSERNGTSKEIPHIEMGKGIDMRDAELSVAVASVKTTGDGGGEGGSGPGLVEVVEKGHVYWNGINHVGMMPTDWKERLAVQGRENRAVYKEISKTNGGAATIKLIGVQENDGWVIVRKNLKKYVRTESTDEAGGDGETKKRAARSTPSLVLSFAIPYLPSKTIPRFDSFKSKAWFFHYRYILKRDGLEETVCFQPNDALCRKTLSIPYGYVNLKNGNGLSTFHSQISVPSSKIVGDPDEDDDVKETAAEGYSSEGRTARSSAPRVSMMRAKRSSGNGDDEMQSDAPSSASYESARLQSSSSSSEYVNPMQKVLMSKRSFVTKDTLTPCSTDERKTKNALVHCASFKDYSLPGTSTYASSYAAPVVETFKTTLYLKVTEENNKRSLSGDKCRLTIYTEANAELKTINDVTLTEEVPLIVDLDYADNKATLKNFSVSTSANRKTDTTVTTLECKASLKIIKGTCPEGVVLLYEGPRDVFVSNGESSGARWKSFDDYLESLSKETNETDDSSPSDALFSKLASARGWERNATKVLFVDAEKEIAWKKGDIVGTLEIPLVFVLKT